MTLAKALRGRPMDSSHQKTTDNRGLSIAVEQLDFGEVWEDGRFRWLLTLQNTGEQDVQIKELLSSTNKTSENP